MCYKLFLILIHDWKSPLIFCLGQKSNLKQPIIPHFLLLPDVAKGCGGSWSKSSRITLNTKVSLALEDYGQAKVEGGILVSGL